VTDIRTSGEVKPASVGSSIDTADKDMPSGLGNAYIFALFNALSFQVVLSSPMVLYARSLNASATVLGLITGMMPLLVMFQIPAAAYIGRVGYKRFVYAGWGMRVVFIGVIALVPLTSGFLNTTTRLALILALLFAFNLSRGISSCAWLPWITSLVPAEVRGRFLSREAGSVNVASFVSFLLSAVCLWRDPAAWQFSLLFAFSAAMGAISLSFLKRIPDAPITEKASRSTQPVPWLAMLRHPPFAKLLREVVAWSLAYGGVQAFCVAFLRTGVGLAEGKILALTSVSFLGGLSSLWFLGSRLDLLGSKPVLTFSLAAWIVVMIGWTALAGGVWPTGWVVVVLLQYAMGLLAALVQMANTRLAMAIIPVMGRAHFFALFSVIGSVALGVSPILWGLMLDALGGNHWRAIGLDWTRYSIFFGGVGLWMGLALLMTRRLDEPTAASLEVLLRGILASPQRLLVKFWPRG
jgi:MFS family permease